MAQRIVTGALLIICLCIVLYFGGWVFAAVALAALTRALWEEMNALTAGGHHPVRWTSYAALVVSVPLMMYYSSIAIIPVLTMITFVILFRVMRRQQPDLIDVVMSVLPMLSIVLPGMCLFGILDTQPRRLETLLMAMVFVISVSGDTFAFFIGSRFGKRKLCPLISPKKTVEGAIGGLIGSMLCAMILAWVFRLIYPDYPFPPMWANLIVGFIGGVAGQMGDLFASLVKRHCKVKDFSNLFPGHGGMLDRMDSILFTAVIVYSYRVILLTVV